MTALSAAAVVVVLAGLVVLRQGGQTPTVQVAGPGTPAAGPDAEAPVAPDRAAGTDGRSLGASPALQDQPLLFPPGSVEDIQARIGADPEVEDEGISIAGNLEVFVAGSEGQLAQLVTVLSVPKADTETAFGLINMPREFSETLASDGPLDTAALERAFDTTFPSAVLDTGEMTISDLATDGPIFGAWVKRWVGSQVDSRIVLIPTATATTVVMASNTDAATLQGILERLTPEGDLLRIDGVPEGFDRLLDPSDRLSLPIDVYAVIAPPAGGSTYGSDLAIPTRLAVNDGLDAASVVLMWNDPFINQSRPFVVRKDSWVIGTLDPAVAMAGMDGAWVSIGDFTVQGRTDLDDPENVATIVAELRQRWDGIRAVEASEFDRALERRKASEVNLFGD